MSIVGTGKVGSLLSALKDAEQGMFTDAERNDLVIQLRETLSKVQTPWQQIQNLVWENSNNAAALKTAHDIGVFQNWPRDGAETLNVEEISKFMKPNVDQALLRKVLNALTYRGTLNSDGPNTFSLNEFSKALREPLMAACLDYWFNFQIPALTNLPEFLQSTSYKLPTDPTNTAWNLVSKDPVPFFGWLQQRPEKMANFAQTMQCYSASQPPWTTLYPVEELIKDHTAGSPLVVDVGGSLGHDITKFAEQTKAPAGSCYLQDKPEVIEKAEVSGGIVKMGHDFFQEQPVKGARAYYLHNILHDWPDNECRSILEKLKAVLDAKVGSKILIHEIVGLEDGARDLLALGEFTVMAILGAPERTENQYRELVNSAGLKVTRIFSHPMSLHSILEVEA